MRRGGLVYVVGPDGVGKTTVRHALVESMPPGIRLETDRRSLLPRLTKGMVTEPHRQEPYPPLLSMLKTFYYYADALLSWCLQVRPAVNRGVWVIRERGWWDMAVDPRRYRLQPHPRLLKLLGRLLPQPELILVLEGAPGLIWARKPELSKEEIARQVQAWRSQLPAGQKRTYLDVALPLEDVVRLASRELEDLVEATASGAAGWTNQPRVETPR
jgi:thymidylate kinase